MLLDAGHRVGEHVPDVVPGVLVQDAGEVAAIQLDVDGVDPADELADVDRDEVPAARGQNVRVGLPETPLHDLVVDAHATGDLGGGAADVDRVAPAAHVPSPLDDRHVPTRAVRPEGQRRPGDAGA